MSIKPLAGEPCLVETKTNVIRDLNDAFRKSFIGGRTVVTAGVVALGEHRVEQVLRLVQAFSKFDSDNDPHGEHDFGLIEDQGEQYFWKIDYYNRSMTAGSDDPSDQKCTTRVLTIMLPREW